MRLLTVSLMVSALAACGGDGGVISDVRKAVAEGARDRAGIAVDSVACANEGTPKEGDWFSCRLSVPGDGPALVHVMMTSDSDFDVDWTAFDSWKSERDVRLVEARLTETLRDKWPALGLSSVRCTEPSAERVLECTLTLGERARVKVPVTVGADRQITFEPRGILTPARLQEMAAHIAGGLRSQGREASADCGSAARYAPPFSTLECQVSYADGTEGRAVVTVSDWDGKFAWVLR